MTANQDKLEGWDAICEHLRVSCPKTVKARGYPIHHYQTHGTKPRVYAFASQLLAHEGGDVLFPNTPEP